MKQPHTEATVDHTDGQQNTGNHRKKGAPDEKGPDRFGGTRAGAENVEPGGAERGAGRGPARDETLTERTVRERGPEAGRTPGDLHDV